MTWVSLSHLGTKSGLMHTIHTYTYTCIQYFSCIHIHNHIHPLQTGSDGCLQRGQLPLETPWRVATPLDQLGWGLRRDRRMHTAQGGPIGSTWNLLWPPPKHAARAGAPKRVWGCLRWRGKVVCHGATCPGVP
jgi:hypothetical protein